LPEAHLVRIDYNSYFDDQKNPTHLKMGDASVLNVFYEELIYLLHLKDDINYELSRKTKYSPLIKKFIKKVSMARLARDKSIGFSADEIKNLQQDTGLSANTVSFKMFQQTYDLVLAVSKCSQSGLQKFCVDMLTNASDCKVKHSINEIGQIEAINLYSTVLSPYERQYVAETVVFTLSTINNEGKQVPKSLNVFQYFNFWSKKYRNGDITAIKPLKSIKTQVTELLGKPMLAIIYGRFKLLKELKLKKLLTADRNTKRISYNNFISCIWDKKYEMSIMAEECFHSLMHREVTRSTEISALTRHVRWDSETHSQYYYSDDVSEFLESFSDKENLIHFLSQRIRGADKSARPKAKPREESKRN